MEMPAAVSFGLTDSHTSKGQWVTDSHTSKGQWVTLKVSDDALAQPLMDTPCQIPPGFQHTRGQRRS